MHKAFLAVVAVLLIATMVPSHADVYALAGAGQLACADFTEEQEDGTIVLGGACGVNFLEVFAEVVPESDPIVEPADGTFSCAGVAIVPPEESKESSLVDVGCGELTVEIDPLLQTMSISGTLASELYDGDTGEFLGTSSLVVDVSGTASGTPIAGAGEGADLATFPYIFAGAGAGMFTGADTDGSVISASLGEISGPGFGVMDEGAGLIVQALV